MSDHKKKIRAEFRKVVFERDKYRCVFCGAVNALDAHHITDRNEMPNGGYVKENGITLCPLHHELAESWHHYGIVDSMGFSPNDLYKKINSSYEIAFKASE
jgi:predicted restriction endonuclease